MSADPEEAEASRDGSGAQLRDKAVAILVIEAVAFLIALATPITPSKTGSTWSPAELFWTDPSYLQKVAADFVLVNLLIAFIALVAWPFLARANPE